MHSLGRAVRTRAEHIESGLAGRTLAAGLAVRIAVERIVVEHTEVDLVEHTMAGLAAHTEAAGRAIGMDSDRLASPLRTEAERRNLVQ